MPSKPLWILICNPNNRRQQFFRQALPNNEKLLTINYLELLSCDCLTHFLATKLSKYDTTKWLVKIDSCGESFAVEKALLTKVNPTFYHQLQFDKGRFAHLADWFCGYQQLLAELSNVLQRLATQWQVTLNYLNTPQTIVAMTDKLSCQQHLANSGINVPKLLPPVQNFEQLLVYMLTTRCSQVFVKARYGSSASGVMALRLNPKTKAVIAKSSLQRVQSGNQLAFYNSLKIQTYTKQSHIKELFDIIMAQQAYVEHWIPKPRLGNQSFDLRILLIKGKAQHYVTRCSHSPMTNLHLANRRGDILELADGAKQLIIAKQMAEQAAQAFPDADCIGADVICTKYSAKVIELNAFGDLLPNVTYQGLSSYQAQVSAMQCY